MEFLQAQDTIKEKLRIKSTSNNYWSLDLIKYEINDAQDWLADLYNWSILQKSFSRSSLADQPYYDYPDTTNAPYSYKDDSIINLYVAGESYSKFEYDDFKKFVSDPENENRTDIKIFADYGRHIFIFPIIKTTGVKIEALGHIMPKTMVNDTDKTAFDGANKSFDRIIIKKALENLTADDPTRKDAPYFKTTAEQDAVTLIQKYSGNKANKRKITPMFNHIDYIGGDGRQNSDIGNFNL